MKDLLRLRVVSTFPCTPIETSLVHCLGDVITADGLVFTRFTQLSEIMVGSDSNSPDVLGTVVLVRLEDWLREQLESSSYDATKATWIRQEFRLRVEEFVSQLGILAHAGRPVWFAACPSNGWIAEQHKLTGLCRTYGNLVLARVRDLPQVDLLNWPASLSKDEAVDREVDRLGRAPFTQETFAQLGQFLGSQIARWVYSRDLSATPSASGGSSELADYLTGLKVRVELAPADRSHREQVDHVLRTVASFTLTGEMPSISHAEVDGLMESGSCMLIDVTDRVSEYGTSGVVICRSAGDDLVVSAWALSCPVLGKQVEYAVLSALSQIAAERQLSRIVFEYRPSARNQPALAFLKTATNEETSQRFMLATDEAAARINKVAAAPGAWSVNVTGLHVKG
jgi:hypothetical protein